MTLAEQLAELFNVRSTDITVSSIRDNIQVKINGQDPSEEQQAIIDGLTDPMIEFEDRVNNRIASLIENAGDLSNPAERKKLADEMRSNKK